MTVYIPTSATG